MIGQYADRNCLKGSALLDCSIGSPQAIYLAHQQIVRATGNCYREKESATCKSSALIARHLSSLSRRRSKRGEVMAGTSLRSFCPPYGSADSTSHSLSRLP